MKNYRLTRLNGENTTVKAHWFHVDNGFVHFFREVKKDGKDSELIAIFANVSSVEEQPSE